MSSGITQASKQEEEGMTMPASLPPSIKASDMASIIEAMKDKSTQSGNWALADALYKVVPAGIAGFEVILAKAREAGITGKFLSVDTLRLYRDTAVRWPKSKRMEGVSFSAHREAMALPGGCDAQIKLIARVAKAQQAMGKELTVTAVRDAVRVARGRASRAVVTTATPAEAASALDVLADLRKGGPEIRAAITSALGIADLDQLSAGVTDVLAHIERQKRRAGKPKKQATVTPITAAPKPKPQPATPAKPRKRRAGDMRGLH